MGESIGVVVEDHDKLMSYYESVRVHEIEKEMAVAVQEDIESHKKPHSTMVLMKAIKNLIHSNDIEDGSGNYLNFYSN